MNNIPNNNCSESNLVKIQNFLPKKNFVFFYLEIQNFNFCLKDYFKNNYPEINLMLILEINDSIESQEKIFFVKSNENIYQPIVKKKDLIFQDDNKSNKYRIIKPIEIIDENYPLKISFNFYSFTNNKLLYIGSEELYLKINQENNLEKFYIYQNIYLKYVSKKIGNLSFNYCYNIKEIYFNEINSEIKKNFQIFNVKN